jgi:hypothetical protein
LSPFLDLGINLSWGLNGRTCNTPAGSAGLALLFSFRSKQQVNRNGKINHKSATLLPGISPFTLRNIAWG